MSIVAAANEVRALPSLPLLAAIALSVVVAVWAGFFRLSALRGPARRAGTLRQVLAAIFVGWSGYFLLQVAFGIYLRGHVAHQGAAAHFQMSMLTSGQLAFIAIAPPAAGLIFLLACDLAIGGLPAVRAIGFRKFPQSLLKGLVAILLFLPLMGWILQITEAIYESVHFVHPEEHQLLKAMGDSGGVTKALLIVAATVVAPLFEELMFRGHIQTFLRLAFLRLTQPSPSIAPGKFDARPGAEAQPPVPQAALVKSPLWPTWLAIVLTSAMFAGVHEHWMVPPIFCLSLCLGYAYERTGSLWTSITMHALFNGISTVIYLSQLR